MYVRESERMRWYEDVRVCHSPFHTRGHQSFDIQFIDAWIVCLYGLGEGVEEGGGVGPADDANHTNGSTFDQSLVRGGVSGKGRG